jgi:EpsI family protein
MSLSISYRYLCTAGALVGVLVAGNLTERRTSEDLAVPLQGISSQIDGWTASGDQTLPKPSLRQLNATSYLSREYRKGDEHLDLFIAYYSQQRAGESMHSPKHCLPGAGWEIWQLGSARVSVDGQDFEINKYSIENVGTRKVMFYWYQSRDRVIASEYLGKLLLARDSLLTGRTAGSLVRVMVDDSPAALKEGSQFSSSAIREVWRCMGIHR